MKNKKFSSLCEPEYNVPPFWMDCIGWPSWFSIGPEKHKLGRGCWDLASCKVSYNSVQQFQRRSWKCVSHSEAGTAICVFRSAPKNTNLVGTINHTRPVYIYNCSIALNPFKRFQSSKSKCLSLSKAGWPWQSWFSYRLKNWLDGWLVG